MKILEVCHYAPNYGGNFIASITDLMQVVRQERPETEFLFVFPEAAKAKLWCQDLMKEHRVYFAGFGFGKINRILCKICKEEKIDIMHLHFTQKNCAILSKLLTKTKILYHVHYTQHSKGLRQKIKNLLSNLLYIPTLDLLIGCSEAVKDSLVKAGIPAKKCDFVNNGVDFPQLDRIKQSHPFDDGKNSLLLLGTHYFRKGLDLAVMAIEPIVEKYNILLQVPSHVPEETMAFVKSVLGKEVDWVKTPPTTDNIGDYYRASAIFLSPSRDEGLSYAVMESLYCKCPVIKTNISSMDYHIAQEDKITFDGSVEDLRNKIEYFLNLSDEDKDKLQTKLQDEIMENYNIRNWSKKMFDIYKSV